MASFLCQIKKVESKVLVSGDVSARVTLEGTLTTDTLKELTELIAVDKNKSFETEVVVK